MRRRWIALATTAALLGIGTAGSLRRVRSHVEARRVEGWRSDIDFLLAEVRRQHYVYRSRPLPTELLRAADALRRRVSELSDERMLVELQRLMCFLGDGHSYVLPAGARRVQVAVLPLRFYLFSDGLFVIDAEPGHERWIGSRVLRFADTPVEETVRRLEGLISRDNEMGIRWIGPFLLRFRGTLEALAGVGPGPIHLTLGDGAARAELAFDTTPSPPVRGLPKLLPSRLPVAPPPPSYLTRVETPYWIEDLPRAHGLYVQFNQVVNAPEEPLESFAGRLRRRLNESQAETLVLDVRHNNGGHTELAAPLLDTLREFDRRPGSRLFVITGRNTFSAAQNFIAQLDRTTRAVFAGEPSSSRPNFVGEENSVKLPWSGALCSISNRYHENIPGDDRAWIEPSIHVDLSSADYFSNRDPVLEALLRVL